MKNYNFFHCMKKTTLAFLSFFDEMKVKRFSDGNPVKEAPVRVFFGTREKTKTRIKAHLDDNNPVEDEGAPESETILPAISVNLTNVEYNGDREMGKFEKVIVAEVLDEDDNLTEKKYNYPPVPYDYTYELTVWSRKAIDVFQIVENILPWFNPSINLTLMFFDKAPLRDIKVSLDSTNLGMVEDIDQKSQREFSETKLSFTAESFVYKPISVQGIIKKITVDMVDWAGGSLDKSSGGSRYVVTGERLEDGEVGINRSLEEYSV